MFYLVMIVPALPASARPRWSMSVIMPVLFAFSANFAAASTFGSIEPALKYPYFLRWLMSFVETL